MTDAAIGSQSPLTARADFQYRWRVYVFFVLVFGYGMWSLHDGFFTWPQENAAWHQMEAEGKKPPQVYHNEAGILINQALGILLPAISLPLFIWLMHRSRGAYRLSEGTLFVPGRDPIPLERIRSLDKSRWERKGIAVVEFENPSGRSEKATMRDMVYERRPTDLIVERIEKHLSGDEVITADPGASPPSTSHLP